MKDVERCKVCKWNDRSVVQTNTERQADRQTERQKITHSQKETARYSARISIAP